MYGLVTVSYNNMNNRNNGVASIDWGLNNK